jgi:hypothetical protein
MEIDGHERDEIVERGAKVYSNSQLREKNRIKIEGIKKRKRGT